MGTVFSPCASGTLRARIEREIATHVDGDITMPVPINLSAEQRQQLQELLNPVAANSKQQPNQKVRAAQLHEFERIGVIKVQGDKVELTAAGHDALKASESDELVSREDKARAARIERIEKNGGVWNENGQYYSDRDRNYNADGIPM